MQTAPKTKLSSYLKSRHYSLSNDTPRIFLQQFGKKKNSNAVPPPLIMRARNHINNESTGFVNMKENVLHIKYSS